MRTAPQAFTILHSFFFPHIKSRAHRVVDVCLFVCFSCDFFFNMYVFVLLIYCGASLLFIYFNFQCYHYYHFFEHVRKCTLHGGAEEEGPSN